MNYNYNLTPSGYMQEGYPMNQYPGQVPSQQPRRHITKKEILEYIQNFTCASELKQVDSFETLLARHICQGTTVIKLLNKSIIEVPVDDCGCIPVEIFVCPVCRKVIVNKQSLDFY